jgi:hypothetical protein
MNTLKLDNVRDFPLTTEALKFMQDSYAILEKLNGLGGDNYILSGCEVIGSSVSNGFMCLKGVVMPFIAGSIQTNVRIIKTVETITVGTGSREQTSYRAEFGTSTNPDENVAWASISRLIGISSLASRLTALEPVNTPVEVIPVTPEPGHWELYTGGGAYCQLVRQGRNYHLYFYLTALTVNNVLFTLPDSFPWPSCFEGKPLIGIVECRDSGSSTPKVAKFTIRHDTRRCSLSITSTVGMS